MAASKPCVHSVEYACSIHDNRRKTQADPRRDIVSADMACFARASIPPSALCSLCRSLRPTFRAEQVSLLNLDRLPSHGLLFVGCLCAVWHTLQSKPPSRLNDPQAQQRKVPPISRIFTARPDLMHLSPPFRPECRRSITLNSKPVPRTTTTCAHKPTYPKPSRYQPNKLNLSPRFHRVDVPLPGSTCAHKPTSQQPWHVWPCPCSCVCP